MLPTDARFKLFAARQSRAAAMPFIMFTALIDMISIGLIIPVLPALVGSLTGTKTDQALWYGVVTFTFSFANFFGSPILGGLSDSDGDIRRHADCHSAGGRRDAVQSLGGQRLRGRHHAARAAGQALRHDGS